MVHQLAGEDSSHLLLISHHHSLKPGFNLHSSPVRQLSFRGIEFRIGRPCLVNCLMCSVYSYSSPPLFPEPRELSSSPAACLACSHLSTHRSVFPLYCITLLQTLLDLTVNFLAGRFQSCLFPCGLSFFSLYHY